MEKNAAIYARVSSVKQKEGENIKSQISALVEYATKCNYNVSNGWIYQDEGFSGSILQRPGLDSLRETIFEGIVDAVFVYSPDRLSRKYAYQLILEMEFQKHGVELIFLNSPKAQGAEEQMAVHFKSIFAEYERAQIVERCRRGRLHRARQGSVSVIPTTPLGYDYISKSLTSAAQYVINKDAEIVKKIFYFYVQKYLSLAKICSELKQEGFLSPRGSKNWCATTVRDILKNPAYVGTAYFGKSEPYGGGIPGRIYHTAKGEKRSNPVLARRSRPKDLWIPIKVPQIISESDFEMAQIKLEENIKTASRNTQKPSILQGLLVCGYCGSTYYKKMRTPKHVYYCCSKRLKKEDCCGPSVKQKQLDDMVWQHVVELLKDPRLIEEEIERRENENTDSVNIRAKLKDIDKEFVRLSKARDKLLDAYQDGESLTLKELKDRLKALEMKQKSMIKEKKSYEDFTSNQERKENLKHNLEHFQKQLEMSEELTIKDKQNVLRLLVSEIIITGDEVEVRHNIPCTDQVSSKFSPLGSDSYNGAPREGAQRPSVG